MSFIIVLLYSAISILKSSVITTSVPRSFQTDRTGQTVETQIRLKKQSNQGLHCFSCLMTKPTKWPLRRANTQISLISVFAVRKKKHWVLSYPLSAMRRLWSDWADAQADLSLCWAHRSFYWFCHEQSNQGLHCLSFRLHLLDTLACGKSKQFKF